MMRLEVNVFEAVKPDVLLFDRAEEPLEPCTRYTPRNTVHVALNDLVMRRQMASVCESIPDGLEKHMEGQPGTAST